MFKQNVNNEGIIDPKSFDVKLYEEYFELTDIVKQLPPVMEKFYSSETNRVCNDCGTVMQAPVKK